MTSTRAEISLILISLWLGHFLHRGAAEKHINEKRVGERSLNLWNVHFPPNLRQIFFLYTSLTHSLCRSDVWRRRAG